MSIAVERSVINSGFSFASWAALVVGPSSEREISDPGSILLLSTVSNALFPLVSVARMGSDKTLFLGRTDGS